MSKVKILNEKEKVRERINVWHGSSNNHRAMIRELINNSQDEILKGRGKNITIKFLSEDKRIIEFTDDCLGIPIEELTEDGTPNYVALFEILFASTKYLQEDPTSGQNGVFLCTLTYASKNISYEIARPNGKVYYISYNKGDRVEDLKVIGQSDKTYTKITFELDTDVFDNPVFDLEDVCGMAEIQAILTDCNITVIDEFSNLNKTYHYDDGANDYFKNILKLEDEDNIIRIKKTIQQKLEKKDKTDDIDIDLVFNITDKDSILQKELLNGAELINHGTIREGILNGLRNIIHKYLKENNKYQKGDKNITVDDINIGLNYICNFKSKLVEYENQTKMGTQVKRYDKALQEVISEYMSIYFIENPKLANKIVEQVLLNSRVRLRSEKSRQEYRKKLQTQSKGLSIKVEGLKDCDMRNSKLEDRILLVSEGVSAKSTIDDCLDSKIMGSYGLGGRFINGLKSSIDDVFKNVPALGLINALGCGVEIPSNQIKKYKDLRLFDKENLRYGKIGLVCDSDEFGSSINLALITFFYQYLPTLLKEGRVYIVTTPRFTITTKNQVYQAYNEDEKIDIINELSIQDAKYDISIRKGLGEFSKEEFWNYVLCEEAREKCFIQITYEGAEDIIKAHFDKFMGEDINSRKDFITKEIVNVDLSEID